MERALDFVVNLPKKINAKGIQANAYYIPTFDLKAFSGMLQKIYDKEDREIKSKLMKYAIKLQKIQAWRTYPYCFLYKSVKAAKIKSSLRKNK